ncbi:MAG: hypothetical protein OXP08_11520, partial [bacterium]|nr:hypothetical protein [bacterium]
EPKVVMECTSIVSGYQEEIETLLDISPAMHSRFCRYLTELNGAVIQLQQLLKKGGSATFVVGNNSVRGHNVPTSKILVNMLERSGLTDIQTDQREIRANRRRYPYGIRGFKGPMESEYVLHAIKP